MEWRWIKSLLIIVFIILNCFLGYKLYMKDRALLANSETIASVKNILNARNMKCNFDLSKVEVKSHMRKVIINNEENIEPKFLGMENVENSKDKQTGRNRAIIGLPIILTTFIRDTEIKDVNINNLVLGYYPEMSQIDKTVLSGEAIPAWLIVLEDGTEYIYNAYLGERMN